MEKPRTREDAAAPDYCPSIREVSFKVKIERQRGSILTEKKELPDVWEGGASGLGRKRTDNKQDSDFLDLSEFERKRGRSREKVLPFKKRLVKT